MHDREVDDAPIAPPARRRRPHHAIARGWQAAAHARGREMKLTRPEAGGEIDDFRAIRSPLPTDLAADGRDPAAEMARTIVGEIYGTGS